MKKNVNAEEIKAIQLDILNILATFCDRNDITYYLAYGTLLGAIRHQGYIPWDDDIDIAMPRKDYMKLLADFNNFHSDYKVVSHYDDITYPYPFAKVQRMKTLLIENTEISYKIGINIDVFPIDGLPDKRSDSDKHIKTVLLLRKIRNAKVISYSKNRSWYKNFVLFLARMCCSFISLNKIILKIDSLALKYDFECSKNVGVVTYSDGPNEYSKKELFLANSEVKFEGKTYNAPQGYHQWLTNIYGDYMQLPPKEKRVSHHAFVAYKLY